MATSSMADHVGRVLGGRYRLLGPIGTGASAHVFLADDVTLLRRVAVKLLHPALAEDESFLRRFRAEAQQVAALTHPNVMRVFDWGESGDGPFLVLEHLGGGSLRALLDAGHLLSPSQALVVGLEAARALDYAHRRGLVHRDIKPANLVFDEEGRLCIADFGLARALAEAAWTEPAGAILGTARYASPEQAQGLSVDGKADVYALALVLVEAVTGRVPFSADTTIATLMARVGAVLEVPPALGPLGPVVERAAAPDPAERLDAGQLVRALDQAGRQLPPPDPLPLVLRPGPAAPSPAGDGAPPPAGDDVTALGATAAAGDHTELGRPDRPPDAVAVPARRRRRWPWAVLAVVVAVAAAAGAMAMANLTAPRHPVPSLRGKTLDEARAEVGDEELRVEVAERRFDEEVPAGRVVEQDPSVGTLREGASVAVVVSRGPRPRAVPDLSGLDQVAAEARLRERGFVPLVVGQASEDVPKGAVLSWSPTGILPKGVEVTVTVSAGPAPREVPEVAGRSYDEAAALLAEQGLKAARAEAFSNDVARGAVVSTRPGAGKPVERDSTVTVVVSKGPDTVAVPDVTGKTVVEATEVLRGQGLQVSGVGGPPRGRRVVIFTDPQAGTQVPRGSGVFLYVR